MRRASQLSKEELTILSGVKTVDKDEAIHDFIDSRRLLGVSDRTVSHYKSTFSSIARDLTALEIEQNLVKLSENDC